MRGGSRDVFVLPLDGSPITAVAHTPAQEMIARWSPDGRRVSYSELGPRGGVWVVSRGDDGTWQPGRRLANGFFSAWSPDGRYISYTSALIGGALGVIAVDGSQPRLLYDGARPGAPAAEMSVWSDDGRTLYFKSHSATGAAAIWSVPFAGGTPRQVVELGDERFRADRYSFRISHGRLYYTLLDRQSNVWVMEVERR
jgi:Tol biopolymer transport system component